MFQFMSKLQKIKSFLNYISSTIFRYFPNHSLLINSYRAFTIQEKLNLRTPYTSIKLIDYLKDYLKHKNKLSIFEYGSGSSTLFFEDYFDEIHSVEHDKEWFEILTPNLKKANVYFVPPKETINSSYVSKKPGFKNLDFSDYVNFIGSLEKKFDVIYIDGRARQECLKIAKEFLNPGGLIILDDSKRTRYRKDFLNVSANKKVLEFSGLGTYIPSVHKSSIIFI